MRTLLLFVSIALLTVPGLNADVIVVPPGGSIQDAVDSAAAGDTILVTSTETPYVENVVWSGIDIVIRGSDPNLPPTISPLDRTLAVLECSALTAASELRDLALVADGSSGSGYEAAIALSAADLRVTSVRVTGFRESRGLGGGAVRSLDGDPTISGSTFVDNASTADGGAIWAAGGRVTLDACTFEGNSARSGGAVALVQRTYDAIEDEELAVTSCSFVGNVSTGNVGATIGGGAVFASGWYFQPYDAFFEVRASFTSCLFEGNSSKSSGGALFLRGCTTSIAACVMIDNATTHRSGGAVYASARPIAIQGSEFSGNTASIPLIGCGSAASGAGGAIAVLADQPDDGAPGWGPIEISGCTIIDNHALFGGGLCIGKLGAPGSAENSGIKMSVVDVNDNLIEGNSALFTGGGLQRLTHHGAASTQTHTIRNNVVRANAATPLLPYGFGGRSLGGGGMLLYGSLVELIVEGNEIASNVTTGSGAGILTEDSNAQIRANWVHDNVAASATTIEDFEAICATCPAATYSCSDGSAWHDLERFLAARGGGMSSTGSGGLSVTGNRFLRNEATGSVLGAGGAIDVRMQPSEVSVYGGNLVGENVASHEGGGIQIEYWPYTWLEEEPPLPEASVDVVQNTLVANATGGAGGGLFVGAEVDAGRVSGNVFACNVAAADGGGVGAPTGATVTPSRYAYNNLFGNVANGPGDQWGGAFDPLTQGFYFNTGFDPRFTGYSACGGPTGDDPCAYRLGDDSMCRHRADPRPDDRNCDGTRGDQGMFGGPQLCSDPPCDVPWVLGLQWGTQPGCGIEFTWETAQYTICTLGYRIAGSGSYTWLPSTFGTSHAASFFYEDSAHYQVEIVSSLPLVGLARRKQVSFAYPCY